ncbi:hypothetical protein KCTC52924_03539 [Arenibacter antarcticus]|uniref:Uncharacterized protein n=1 Tax=Arenibacter antarcticus TaxID=2040469 RepID=A0ABW5VE82_9FLAO|nr:hypothetical protein [Arenibacter sp. H213]MCM4166599.1 hypothetical protein [Arenibacter sp. H213]
MKKETKIDTDYLQGFNLGYDLAKELNLTSPMFKDVNSDDNHMNAMQAGMAEYTNEIMYSKDNLQTLDGKSRENIGTQDDNGKGLNQSV